MHSNTILFNPMILNNQNSRKFNIKMNDLQWLFFILASISIIQLVYALHFQIFSILISLFNGYISGHSFYLIYKINMSKLDTLENIIFLTKLKDMNYLLKYSVIVSMFDLLFTLIFSERFLVCFQSDNGYELYFCYLKLFFLIFRCLYTLTIYLMYFKDLNTEESQSTID